MLPCCICIDCLHARSSDFHDLQNAYSTLPLTITLSPVYWSYKLARHVDHDAYFRHFLAMCKLLCKAGEEVGALSCYNCLWVALVSYAQCNGDIELCCLRFVRVFPVRSSS